MRTLPKLNEKDTVTGLIVKEYFMTGMDYFDTKYKSDFKVDDMKRNINDYINISTSIRIGLKVQILKPERLIKIDFEINP